MQYRELEAKFVLKEPQEVFNKLKAIYGKPVEIRIWDTYFDTPDYQLLKNYSSALRLRKKDERTFITFKRKLKEGEIFEREELEDEVSRKVYEHILKTGRLNFYFRDIELTLYRMMDIYTIRSEFAKGITLDRVSFGDVEMFFLEVEGDKPTIEEFISKYENEWSMQRTNISKLEWALKIKDAQI